VPGRDLRPPPADHVFACAFQIGRALARVARIVGSSPPAAALRAATWRAIFTHDMRRHLRSCVQRPNDASTLLTGETGTGKELVAEAIGRSAFVPFDPKARRFVAEPGAGFRVVHIAALSESLMESELFGHERGAFTGAVKERRGLLDTGGPNDVVFFDEIGELGMRAQVTLLRVLDGHGYRRVGDGAELAFTARVVAATHRDLGEQIRRQAFRLDLYERLAAVQIRAPSLRERLAAAPGERRELVRCFAAREVDAEDVEALTDQVEAFLDAHLPVYPWPGNVRELKRCVESVCVTGGFVPLGPSASAASAAGEGEEDPVRSIRAMTLSADDVLRRYTSMVFEKTGRRQDEAARVLGVDRKTVAKRLDRAWLLRRARPTSR
jgi:DNA-binding NtrC family response regulator